MSTKTLGAVGWGSGRQNVIPTIPTKPTVPTIPTPWGCSKLEPNIQTNRPYTSLEQNFVCNQPPLVMRSRGEPLSTTVKVVTA